MAHRIGHIGQVPAKGAIATGPHAEVKAVLGSILAPHVPARRTPSNPLKAFLAGCVVGERHTALGVLAAWTGHRGGTGNKLHTVEEVEVPGVIVGQAWSWRLPLDSRQSRQTPAHANEAITSLGAMFQAEARLEAIVGRHLDGNASLECPAR